jgi:hypothetical protein
MKKPLWILILLLPLNLACYKGKSAEVEMQLPTPIPIPTAVLSPTPLFTQPPTPTATPLLQYSIEDIKGTALIIPLDATVPETAEEGETVEAGDELLTKDDSEMTLALNDNTMIHVSANSQIKVLDLTPNTTQGFSSRIELILGNILSEVEKLNESESSFEVEAGGVVCGVRGTAFEVQNQGGNVSTSTFHGVVEMKKDGLTQNVNVNEHSTFSLKKSNFSSQRHLSLAEKNHYKIWVKTKAVVQKKRENRMNNRVAPAPAREARPQVNKKTEKVMRQNPNTKPKSARLATPKSKKKKIPLPRSKDKKPIKKPVQIKIKPKTHQAPQNIKSKSIAKPSNNPIKPQKPGKKQARKKNKKN